jgi:hypothetical protein
MQIVSFLRSIIVSSVTCQATTYFSSLPHKRQDFQEEEEDKKLGPAGKYGLKKHGVVPHSGGDKIILRREFYHRLVTGRKRN